MSKARWQPIVLILDNRLECNCGSIAIFVNGKTSKLEDDSTWLYDATAYCQDCWQAYIEEEENVD